MINLKLEQLHVAVVVPPADKERIKKVAAQLVDRHPLPRYEATIRFFKRQITVSPESSEVLDIPVEIYLASAAALKKSHFGYFKEDVKFRMLWREIQAWAPDTSSSLLVDWAQANVDR
jgi:hypothetical protein